MTGSTVAEAYDANASRQPSLSRSIEMEGEAEGLAGSCAILSEFSFVARGEHKPR